MEIIHFGLNNVLMVTIIPTIPPNHPFRFSLETRTYMKDKACGNQAVGGYGEGNKAVNR